MSANVITTVIFDLDGVIIDSEHLWDKAVEEFLQSKGAVYRRSEIKHLMGGKSLLEAMRIMQQHYKFSGSASGNAAEDTEELVAELIAIVKNLYENEAHFIDGFEDFYNKVRQYKLCIATALDPRLLSIVKKKLGLDKMFGKHIYSIDQIGYVSKPNPDIFLHAAKQMQSQPQNCIVIEDAPNGVSAARRAGMKCIAITATYTADKLKDADVIVSGFSEIDMNDSEG